MPTLVIKNPDGTQQERDWVGQITIGGAAGNDVVLAAGGLSARHVLLVESSNGVEVEDRGSEGGTLVDGKRIATRTTLRPDSVVSLGQVQLWLRPARPSAAAAGNTQVSPPPKPPGPPRLVPSGSPPAPPAAADRSDTPPNPIPAAAPAAGGEDARGPDGLPRITRAVPRTRPQPRPDSARPRVGANARSERPARGAAGGAEKQPFALRGLEGPASHLRFVLSGTMTVGRVSGTDIVVEDDSISRRHAEVEVRDGKVRVRDLGSANGTLVNGERIQGEIVLKPGDVIGFGVVDFQLEPVPGDALARAGAKDVARPAAGGLGRGSPSPDDGDGAPTRMLPILGGGFLGLVLLAALLFRIFAPPERPPDQPIGGTRATDDQPMTLEQMIARCRSYADPEGGGEPRWLDARRICERVRQVDPINEEASSLLKRVDRELLAKESFDRGKKLLERNKEVEALDHFKKLTPQSWYFSPARIKVDDIRKDLTRSLSADCRKYAQAGAMAQALEPCQKYMELVCQDMPPEELHPPADTKINLGKQRLNPGEWRPQDPAYLDFLRVRAKLEPKGEVWECPANEMLKSVLRVAGTGADLEEALRGQYPEPALRRAVLLYWKGKHGDAETALFKIREDIRLAKLHQQADALRKDLDVVEQLYKVGQSELQVEDPESAAEPMREAIDADEKIMGLETVKSNPSWYRRGIQQDMAYVSYKAGKTWADRGDRRKACKLWKVGWSFSQGYPELSRAINACTQWANLASKMEECSQVNDVLDYAIPGDGFKEKAEARRQELNCL